MDTFMGSCPSLGDSLGRLLGVRNRNRARLLWAILVNLWCLLCDCLGESLGTSRNPPWKLLANAWRPSEVITWGKIAKPRKGGALGQCLGPWLGFRLGRRAKFL